MATMPIEKDQEHVTEGVSNDAGPDSGNDEPDRFRRITDLVASATVEGIQPAAELEEADVEKSIRLQLELSRAYLKRKLEIERAIGKVEISYTLQGTTKGETFLRIEGEYENKIFSSGDDFNVFCEGGVYASGTVISLVGSHRITAKMTPRKGIPPRGTLKKVSNYKILERQLKEVEDVLEKRIKSQPESAFLHPTEKFTIPAQDDAFEMLAQVPESLLADKDQIAAIVMALQTNPISLIHGPSGTGKTTVARELVRYWVEKRKARVLVVSHSNQGLDKLLREIKNAGVRVARGGTRFSAVDSELVPDFLYAKVPLPKRKKFINQQTGRFDKDGYERARRTYYKELSTLGKSRNDSLRAQGGCVGVTLNSFCSDPILKHIETYDYVIIDEASRAHIHEILPVLAKTQIKAVFIGDHLQLGNMPLSGNEQEDLLREAKFAGALDPETVVQELEEGPFEVAMKKSIFPHVMLRTNRRSNHEIVRLVSEAGYEGRLIPGKGFGGVVHWYDTRALERDDNKEKSIGTSYINVHEAYLVARYVIEAIFKRGIDPSKIGVTSPYSAQIEIILEKLQKLLHNNPAMYEAIAPNVATVDSFQGDERDIMFVSTVVSNMEGRIGFLEEMRRLRVALSRARNELHIIGNSASLIDNNSDEGSRNAFEAARRVINEVGQIRELKNTPQASRPGRRRGERSRKALAVASK